MIRALCIFILLFASVWLGVELQRDPGYLLIAIDHWTIEMTLWVGIIGLILCFIVLHFLFNFLSFIAHLPTSWGKRLAKHRVQTAQAQTRRGLIEFSEGHWQQAKNHLIKALPDTDTPLLNYLTAARAAQEMGDNKLRDDYLRQAQQSMPEAKIAVELTQAQLQLANRQWEQALATLRHLQDLAPQHPYVLKLLVQLYEEVKDWPQLILLLPELKRHHAITDNAFTLLEHKAYLQAILDLIKQDQMDTLTTMMGKLPRHLTNDTQLIREYANYLLYKQDNVKAESILRCVLKKQFSEPLIALYGKTKVSESQLKFAESLLREHPHSHGLFLCLGRLCKTQNLWGKARVYFEQSIEFGESMEAYFELGELLLQLNSPTEALEAFKKGLLLALTPHSD